MTNHDPAKLRKLVYALLITVAASSAAGRILSVERVYEPTLAKDEQDPKDKRSAWPGTRPEPMPTFSSNDRSRWATIRALVDNGTYVIGDRDIKLMPLSAGTLAAAHNEVELAVLLMAGYQVRIKSDRSIWREKGWEPGYETVDRVLDPDTMKFYSSKPPLLSTLLAGLYWLIQMLTGWTLANNVWEVVRTTLLLVNVLPFVVYLALLANLLERFTSSEWTRLFVMAAACFATLVTPFLITLNNHNIGTYSVMFALYCSIMVWCGDNHGAPTPRSQNGVWERGVGAPWYYFALAGLFASFAITCELPAAAFAAGLGLMLLIYAPRRTLLFFVPAALVPIAGFFLTNYLAIGQFRPAYSEFGSLWYEYEGSHWSNPGTRSGIDFASYAETREQYVFHVLMGHHGLFSLTPMWLLAFAGMFLGMKRGGKDNSQTKPQTRLPWWFFPASLLLSLIVIGFYLVKSDNYGGWTSGLRWLMWMTPIWLICMLPTLDWLGKSRRGRGFAYVLLAFSVLSVSYPAWNPWRHPWLYRWMDAQGWIPY